MSEVTLRPVREDDLRAMEEVFTTPEGTGPFQWFGWRNMRQWIRTWTENRMLGEDQGTLIVVRGGETAGFVTWRQVLAARDSPFWNMGILVYPSFRGQGVGSRAQRLLVEYLFANTRVNRIEAGTDIENYAEQRALEKAGFQREGVLRGHYFRHGGWHDTVLYSILRHEIR